MLDEHFSPRANFRYERHIFRQMKQENSESVHQNRPALTFLRPGHSVHDNDTKNTVRLLNACLRHTATYIVAD